MHQEYQADTSDWGTTDLKLGDKDYELLDGEQYNCCSTFCSHHIHTYSHHLDLLPQKRRSKLTTLVTTDTNVSNSPKTMTSSAIAMANALAGKSKSEPVTRTSGFQLKSSKTVSNIPVNSEKMTIPAMTPLSDHIESLFELHVDNDDNTKIPILDNPLYDSFIKSPNVIPLHPITILIPALIQKIPSFSPLKVLMDPGSDALFIHENCLQKGATPQLIKPGLITTLNGSTTYNCVLWLDQIMLPKFSKSKRIN